MKENLLSVIIPVYNDENNILRCLESLSNQSLKNLEIIVVNDASTDNTLNILTTYQRKHNIKIINMDTNVGVSACRNIGMKVAKSPYITFVDSDDWIDISTYAKCKEQFIKNPDVIIFGLVYDYANYNRREQKYLYSDIYNISGTYALNIYAHTISAEISITPIVNNKIYKKKFLNDNNISFYETLRYQEDDVFTFEVLSKCNDVIFINECNYHYCQRMDSQIHNVSEISIHGFINSYSTLKNSLENDGLFDVYKKAFYLKFKSSLLGVIRRTIDYEKNISVRNQLLSLLLTLILQNFNMVEIFDTFDFFLIRKLL